MTIDSAVNLSLEKPLSILHLEDNPSDAELVRSKLDSETIDCDRIRVETRADFVSALENGQDDSRKVLCIHDDSKALKLAQLVPLRHGYLSICKSNARSALKLLEKERPAAIILDLMMPGMAGFEFMDKLRRRPDATHTPVIIWTIKDLSLEDRARLQASAQAIVIKGRHGATQLFKELQGMSVDRRSATNVPELNCHGQ